MTYVCTAEKERARRPAWLSAPGIPTVEVLIRLCTVPHGDLCTPMIYVDVDDTLVLYRDTEPVQHSGVLMGMGFLVNHELVDRILQYRKPAR